VNTLIPDWQRRFHIATEIASVLFVPFVLAAAKDARQPHKTRLRVLAAGMVLVDGFLVYRWFNAPELKRI
jgi:hypothetical protein